MAALFGPLLVALLVPRAATCPDGFWIDGIRPSGAYECLLTVGDNDSPAIARTTGTIRCLPDEQPLVVDFRRAACVRRPRNAGRGWRAMYDARGKRLYRTARGERAVAKARRDELRREGLCINGRDHGKATHGCRCATCYATHRRSA